MCFLKTTFQLTSNEEEWIIKEQEFDDRWNIPNCIGAMDGTHISLKNQGTQGHITLTIKEHLGLHFQPWQKQPINFYTSKFAAMVQSVMKVYFGTHLCQQP